MRIGISVRQGEVRQDDEPFTLLYVPASHLVEGLGVGGWISGCMFWVSGCLSRIPVICRGPFTLLYVPVSHLGESKG